MLNYIDQLCVSTKISDDERALYHQILSVESLKQGKLGEMIEQADTARYEASIIKELAALADKYIEFVLQRFHSPMDEAKQGHKPGELMALASKDPTFRFKLIGIARQYYEGNKDSIELAEKMFRMFYDSLATQRKLKKFLK